MSAASLQKAQRTAAIAAGLTVLLMSLKIVVGYMADANVLLADAAHSSADIMALGASWFGLKLAARPATGKFPYGFYRAETLATLLVAVVIISMGGNLLFEGIAGLSDTTPLKRPYLAIATAFISIVTAAGLAWWEKRVARETNSQSLAASGDEALMDTVSSGVVFVALIASKYHVPYLTGVATILISAAVVRVGLLHGWTALLSLMDASIDPELEDRVRERLLEIPGVRAVHRIKARRSGPYYFVEGHALVAGTMEVDRSHMLVHQAEQLIRERESQIEGVILHIEPYRSDQRRVLVPIDREGGLDAMVSRHFGRAPSFLIATVHEGQITETKTLPNPFRGREIRAGLAVINRFVSEESLDAIVVREIGEIAYHAVRDSYVDAFHAKGNTARDAVEAFVRGDLAYMTEPTHGSDEPLSAAP